MILSPASSLLLALVACSDGSDSNAPTDGGAADGGMPDGGSADGGTPDGGSPTTDSADPCADVPLVNYNTFGAGFMTANCQGCHATNAPDRYGAPESVVFDTVEQVWAWSVRILELVPGDEERMPPAGGITEDDATRLRWWLECAEPGT